jgi:PPOX class probable F420-dependent enzyme
MSFSPTLDPEALRFLREARIGHLATARANGEPSVIPVCFAVEPPHVFTVIDAKPKSVEAAELRRVRDLTENPQAALVVDRWDEDWSRLGYVLLRGRVELIAEGPVHQQALRLLRAKYDLYRAMKLDRALLIDLHIASHHRWGDLSRPQFSATPLGSAI